MTEPRQLATVVDYDGLIAAFRLRAEELNVSRETIDAVTGLQAGYCAKLLAPVPIKKLGLVSLGPMLQALGLALCVVVDDESAARFSAKMTERKREVPGVASHEVIEIRLTRRKLRLMGRRGRKKQLAAMTSKQLSKRGKMMAKRRWRKVRAAQASARRRAKLSALAAKPEQAAIPAPSANRPPSPND
jgi:hypothetical protein